MISLVPRLLPAWEWGCLLRCTDLLCWTSTIYYSPLFPLFPSSPIQLHTEVVCSLVHLTSSLLISFSSLQLRKVPSCVTIRVFSQFRVNKAVFLFVDLPVFQSNPNDRDSPAECPLSCCITVVKMWLSWNTERNAGNRGGKGQALQCFCFIEDTNTSIVLVTKVQPSVT